MTVGHELTDVVDGVIVLWTSIVVHELGHAAALVA